MKWFKHLVGSTSDPDLMEAELKYKANGTYVFWRVLEILAREDVLTDPLIMNFKVFKSWFPVLSSKKLKEIIQFFCDKERMAVEYINDDIKIFCNKLSVISSNYTKKVQRENEQPAVSEQPQEVEVRSKIKKENKNKDKNKTIKKFTPPTLEEVEQYIKEEKYDIDAFKWWNHYNSNGWKVGKNSMKSWKSAVATWLKPKQEDWEIDENYGK